MTLLSHQEIEAALDEQQVGQRLVVMPLLNREEQVGPASIDVRLGTRFWLPRRTTGSGVDPGEDAQIQFEDAQEQVVVAFGEKLWLHPGQFILGSTLEFLRFPDHLAAYVVGRSSWGRAGLLVATAIMIQPGFSGSLTLELVNHGEAPIALYAGCRIAQLAIHSMGQETDASYSGKYRGPTGPEVSRLGKERAEIRKLRDVATRLSTS